jgi:hypothetical protein
MMMGYYDRNGYGGYSYSNLVPGGQAELETFFGPPTGWGSLANNTIASTGHVNDFYQGGYLASGDDDLSDPHDFDSLADFMGTSQDSVSNINGSTAFYSWTNGAPFLDSHALTFGVSDSDGMYGIVEYLAYSGYSAAEAYTQRTDNLGLTYGFSFADYMDEIDAGRVVMLHVTGHSMFGYGYDVSGQTVYLHDTWNLGPHSMTWGGSYDGLDMWGVTSFTPAGSSTLIPVPATILMLGSGLLGLVCLRRKIKV